MCRKQRANNAFARCLVDNLAVMQDSESLTIFMEHVKTCSHLAGILSILKTIVFVFTFLISRSAEPPELSPLSFGGDILNEGDFAQASCIVRKGDQPLAISWSFHGSNITSELGIVITPLGVRGSSLMIPSVGHKHRGTYTCKASNAAGVRTEQVDLNVNGIYKKVKGWHCI